MLEYERERIICEFREVMRHASVTRANATTWHDDFGRLRVTVSVEYIDGTEEMTTWKEGGDAAED